MEFNLKLKKARSMLGISQESLARELNVSFATINRLEKGKSLPCYKTLLCFEKFCEANNLYFEKKKGEKK